MASVNPHARELVFKIVFYGPGLGGKTTTLQYIHAATKAEHRGKLVSLATATDRTLYFDFLPVRVPRVRGMAVRLQLFTVPGQALYSATRKLVLSGADGIVFVADSQERRAETNQEALDDLLANLAEHSRTLEEVPHTFHWNKRDLSNLLSIDDLERRFNKLGAPSLGTIATKGDGVFEGLERITRLVLRSYDDETKSRGEPSNDPRVPEPRPSMLPIDNVAQSLRTMEEPVTSTLTVIPASLPPEAVLGTRGATSPDVATSSHPRSEPPLHEPSPLAPPIAAAFEPIAGSSAPNASNAPTGSNAPNRLNGSNPPPAPDALLSGVSFAELWPAFERERVRHAETLMAKRDAAAALLATDLLITRILASTAALVGTIDAPRDPAVVAVLLGLDGPRYLEFRMAVRAARQCQPITMTEALLGFALALEARRLERAIAERARAGTSADIA